MATLRILKVAEVGALIAGVVIAALMAILIWTIDLYPLIGTLPY